MGVNAEVLSTLPRHPRLLAAARKAGRRIQRLRRFLFSGDHRDRWVDDDLDPLDPSRLGVAVKLGAVTVTVDKSGRTSACILLWRSRETGVEVVLAHQGGPLWVSKDIGHWTIPKGEVEPGEELVAVARREFAEETGHEAPNHPLIDLGKITQKSGKLVLGWAVQGDLDPSTAVSNTFRMEWPPHSGVFETFPEIDRVEWFTLDDARRKLKAAQVPFLDRLQAALTANHA